MASLDSPLPRRRLLLLQAKGEHQEAGSPALSAVGYYWLTSGHRSPALHLTSFGMRPCGLRPVSPSQLGIAFFRPLGLSAS